MAEISGNPKTPEQVRHLILDVLDKLASDLAQKGGMMSSLRRDYMKYLKEELKTAVEQLRDLAIGEYAEIVVEMIDFLTTVHRENYSFEDLVQRVNHYRNALLIRETRKTVTPQVQHDPITVAVFQRLDPCFQGEVARLVQEILAELGYDPTNTRKTSELQARIRELEADLEAQEAIVARLQQRTKAAETTASTLRDQSLQQTTEIEHLRAQLTTALGQSDELRKVLERQGQEVPQTALDLGVFKDPVSLLGQTEQGIMFIYEHVERDIERFKRRLHRAVINDLFPDRFVTLLTNAPLDPAMKQSLREVINKRWTRVEKAIDELAQQLQRDGRIRRRWIFENANR